MPSRAAGVVSVVVAAAVTWRQHSLAGQPESLRTG